MDKEILKMKIRTPAPYQSDSFHFMENLLPYYRQIFFLQTNHFWQTILFDVIHMLSYPCTSLFMHLAVLVHSYPSSLLSWCFTDAIHVLLSMLNCRCTLLPMYFSTLVDFTIHIFYNPCILLSLYFTIPVLYWHCPCTFLSVYSTLLMLYYCFGFLLQQECLWFSFQRDSHASCSSQWQIKPLYW